MEPHILPFLELTPRGDKPRWLGITIVKDDRYPTSLSRDMLDTCASYVGQVAV